MKKFIVIDCLDVAETTKCYEIKSEYSQLDTSWCEGATIHHSCSWRPIRIEFKTTKERDRWLMVNILNGHIVAR